MCIQIYFLDQPESIDVIDSIGGLRQLCSLYHYNLTNILKSFEFDDDWLYPVYDEFCLCDVGGVIEEILDLMNMSYLVEADGSITVVHHIPPPGDNDVCEIET